MDRELEAKLSRLPSSPGVYLMKDATGEVIYVGKAAALRSRVRSYFQAPSTMPTRTRLLAAEIADFDVIRTKTEAEAFLVEDSLIKRHQPRFNVRLRDDKRYPYLKITNEPFPRILVVRRRGTDGARYFGPYTSAKSMRTTLKLAQKLFPIRTCALPLPLKTPRRPCLNYHIGRCLAPCAERVDQAEYARAVDGAALLLEGRITGLIRKLEADMHKAAENQEYERAAGIRDRLGALNRSLERQSVALADLIDRDAIGLTIDGEDALALVFQIRGGRVSGREAFSLRAPMDPDPGEILSAFLAQHYASATYVPKQVLLPHPIEDVETLEAWLTSLRGNRVTLHRPQRGEKRRLVELASENARFTLASRQRDVARSEESTAALMELSEALSLSSIPQRIEAYDISNTGGEQAVGSMVVFEDGRPRKDAYRRFKIHISGHPDDVSMMREMLQRRFQRALAELADPTVVQRKFADLPDLVLVDGGKGQLNAALSVLSELDIEGMDVIGLAKRLEQVYRPGQKTALRLSQDSKGLLLLCHIRDEAHRFAISYHRKLRAKRSISSVLDDVPGVGPKRKNALIRAFGSVDALLRAPAHEIADRGGVPLTVAEAILTTLRS